MDFVKALRLSSNGAWDCVSEDFQCSSSPLAGGEAALEVEFSDRAILAIFEGGGILLDCRRDGGLLLGR